MQVMEELDSKIDELIELWPRLRKGDVKLLEKKSLCNLIKTQEDYQKVRNEAEIAIEDNKSVNKLPNLCSIAVRVLKHGAYSGKSTKPVESEVNINFTKKTEQPSTNSKLESMFANIWDVWPKNPDFVERRQNAFNAFVQVSGVMTPEDLQSACCAYANNFNDGSGVYAKTLKNFLTDKDLVSYWLDISKRKDDLVYDKECFNAAYAWYPGFSGKDNPKTKDASWVIYWRNVPKDNRIEFLAAVMAYRAVKNRCNEDESIYTKSFQNFVLEWEDAVKYNIYTKRDLMEAKGDLSGYFFVKTLLECGLDVDNIWGGEYMSFFSDSALKHLYMQGSSFKDALLKMLQEAPSVVEFKLSAKNGLLMMKDPELAKRQMVGFDAAILAEKVYDIFIKTKLTEMPKGG